MRFFVDVLTGVPSIVFGLFIYIVLVVGTGSSYAGYKGSLALSLLMLPVVIRSAEVILLLVPDALRESALALGAPRWRVIFRIVLPTALPGMVTGVLLAVARAAGETAPLLFTAAATRKTNFNLGAVHELAAGADLQRRHLADDRRRKPCLGRRADARRDDPAAQPDRPTRLAKEPPRMSTDAMPPQTAERPGRQIERARQPNATDRREQIAPRAPAPDSRPQARLARRRRTVAKQRARASRSSSCAPSTATPSRSRASTSSSAPTR